jgi:dihydroorotase
MYLYDLLVKGGRVFDPASGKDEELDIGITGHTIVAIEKDIPRANARQVVEAKGYLVTPGFIDLHAHVADGITRHGLAPDRAGVLQGVTTIVDGGSLGSHTFLGFRRYVLPANRTTVYAFLNLSYSGQARMPELRSLDDLDEETLELVLRTNRDVIKGIKVRCVSPMVHTIGATVADIAHRFARMIGGRVMVHIGDHGGAMEAQAVTERVIERLEPGDIITHPYTPWPGGAIGDNGRPIIAARDAAQRGVVIDVGRGRMNFSLKKTRQALEAGFWPTTISTDISLMTIHGPVFGLADTASIFLNLGLDLRDVIVRITANPAKALGIFEQVGSIECGKRADLSIIDYRDGGQYEFFGFEEERMTGDKLLVPVITVKDGCIVPCELPYGSAMHHAAQGKA